MKLCIDPGHGNSNRKSGVYDPGAEYGKDTEAAIVLEWALTGKWIAKERGIPVFLTRDDDSDPTPVSTRDDRAEQAGCTHFLSLHCNAASGSAHGTETYYRDSQDKAFAQKIQQAALKALELRDRGLKTESDSQHTRLAVLDFKGPASLLELGFIDANAEIAPDRGRLKDRNRRITFWNTLFDVLEGKG
ncbi:MAG: N-acetylmuramoyl-L-alanine amidase [Armatimonas sp.]